mgnify:CR=1 FL=1
MYACQPLTSRRMISFCSMRRLSPSGVSRAMILPASMIQRREIFQILAPGQFPIDTAFARQRRAETAPHIVRLPDDVVAVDIRRAARGLEQGAQHADRGGLARAVRTQQAEDLIKKSRSEAG